MTIQNNPWLYEEIGKARRDPSRDKGVRAKEDLAADALGAKVKALIALAVAVTSGGEVFTTDHINGARGAGATHREMEETVRFAVLLGGEASAVYGAHALAAIKQFEADMAFYRELAEKTRSRRWAGLELADHPVAK